MSLSLDLGNRVVMITGGNRGVGLGISRQFVAAGAMVVTCARTDAPAVGVAHYTCDVRDPDAVGELVERIVSSHGSLDVLVNNAGGAPFALATDGSDNFHAKIVGLNLLAPLTMMRAANAVMQGQADGGSIVNVSSVSALRPSRGTSSYGAA